MRDLSLSADGQEMERLLLDILDQESIDDITFDNAAMALFRYQFQHNGPYRDFCRRQHRMPQHSAHWQEVPPVPIAAFKMPYFACEPTADALTYFQTSGTTDPSRRGRQYHPNFSVWEKSMRRQFRSCVMPDHARMRVLIVSPADDVQNHSSLSHYLSVILRDFADSESLALWGEAGLNRPVLERALSAAVEDNVPVLLAGATFGFVPAFDHWRDAGLRWQLPDGSRLLDTGGSKGQIREVARDAFASDAERILGIPSKNQINMYGMTELSSQFYTVPDRGDQAFVAPPWVRVQILDPASLRPLEIGAPGLIAHYDLANRNSALAILTEDIGRLTPEGLRLLGRQSTAEPRGCSLTVEEWTVPRRPL